MTPKKKGLRKPQRKSVKAKTAALKVERLPPSDPAARDEGPRLLPHDSRQKHDHPALASYVALADIALRDFDQAEAKQERARASKRKNSRK